jgi:hypothetical protein
VKSAKLLGEKNIFPLSAGKKGKKREKQPAPVLRRGARKAPRPPKIPPERVEEGGLKSYFPRLLKNTMPIFAESQARAQIAPL